MAIADLIQSNPKISIVIIGLAISFLISLVNYLVLDKEKMREIKAKQKAIQEKMKAHQKAGEHDKALAVSKDMLAHNMEIMKHSLKPTLITAVPILILFGFIKGVYSETSIASSWFWYYLISAVAGSIIFRKLFKLP